MGRRRRSRYSNPWYGIVLGCLKLYPDQLDGTEQGERIRMAIDEAIDETMQEYGEQDGTARVEAIRMIYFRKTHTVDGVAMKLSVGRRTVQRWTSTFVKQVGRKAGFM